MGSQSIEILRQGIWASLTGGWFYDPHQKVFCNTFHLYLWLYLACVPFCVYLYCSWSWAGWFAHLLLLAFVASVIKAANYLLHHIFDTGECFEEEIIVEPASSSDIFRHPQNASSGHQRTSSFEAMEMQVVRSREIENTTPPVGCSSRNSVTETELPSNSNKTKGVIDLKVEVHHKESSESEEGSLKREKDGSERETFLDCPTSSSEPTVHPEKRSPVLSDFIVVKDPTIGIASNPQVPHSSEESSYSSPFVESSFSSTLYEKARYEFATEIAANETMKSSSQNTDSKQPCRKFSCKRIPIGSKICQEAVAPSGEKSSVSLMDGENLVPPLFETQTHLSVTPAHFEISKRCRKSREHRKGKASSKLKGTVIPPHKSRRINSPRKCTSRRQSKGRGSSEDDNFVSDPDTEEEIDAKCPDSPLLNQGEASSKSGAICHKVKSNSQSKVYHPLICRTSITKASSTSGFTKDSVKVTTLTFENIYADDETSSDTVKMSSSSDDTSGCIGEKMSSSSDDSSGGNVSMKKDNMEDCEGAKVFDMCGNEEPDSSPMPEVAVDRNVPVEGCDDLKNVCEEDTLSELSNSSCPDIDWLFYHSESDSEFTSVGESQTQVLKSPAKEGEESSWNVVRSSPESYGDPKPSLRDHETSSRQGAIPKQRRQGVVVSEGDETFSTGNEDREAAGVTMDLVRKMLDVFSSYPENRPRDIKKLLVLVSLESDRRGGDDDNCEKEPVQCIEEGSSATSPTDISESKVKEKCSKLHRSTAIRRRRIANGQNGMASVSDNSLGVDFPFSSNSDQPSRFHTDFQTTFSGAVSYFGKSDDEGSTDCEIESNSKGKGHKKSLDEPVLPLSAIGAFASSSVHLATCHDDTTNGAVHCFQDERGHWFTYTFNNSSVNMTSGVMPLSENYHLQQSLQRTFDLPPVVHRHQPPEMVNAALAREDVSLSSSSMSLCSGLTVVLDNHGSASPSASAWQENSKMNKESLPSFSSSPLPPSSLATQRRLSPLPSSSFSSQVRSEEGRSGVRALMNRHIQRHHVLSPSSAGPRNPRENSRNAREVQMLSTGSHHLHLLNLGTPGNPLQLFTSAIFDRRRLSHRMHSSLSTTNDGYFPRSLSGIDEHMDLGLVKQLKFTTPAPQTVQYYKIKLHRSKTLKIKFDRLSLLALLDRNLTILESLLNVVLIVLVGFSGSLVLYKGFYHEFNVLIFSVVMASCQYSLFKSVQPDAASPTHGYNHIILYSRPIYFILCCLILLSINFYLESSKRLPSFYLYGFELTNPLLLASIRDCLLLFLLFFPVIFSLGLLPQINTFFMYLLEQIDIHLFGGNATTSLSSALYCVIRSCLAVFFLLGFAYGGLTEKSDSQHILYSIFCALMVSFSYHLSRSAANPSVMWQLVKKHLWPEDLLRVHPSAPEESSDEETKDPLPDKLCTTVTNRLMHDTIVCSLSALIVCGVHSSTVFTVLLQGKFPDFLISVWIIACLLGFLNHYIIPQLRTQQPWMCVAQPPCMSHEYAQFEVYDAARVMWFEKVYLWSCMIEKNIIFPVLFLCALTKDANTILEKHPVAGTLMIVVCGLKCLRSVYSQTQFQFLILAFTILFFNWDLGGLSESFLVDYFFMSIIFSKVYEFILKLKFIVTYIAPWQITWGSAFHAFAQPFSVPHSAMLFIQAAISAILSTPLNPILGSAIFITSYVRPVKFWERDYNTKRMDQSNTRLSSLLEQNPGADDNNLNSIFYEHLTRSLQHSLCGDLIMGRWGPASQGDCFVLASDNLNCLVHIIEIGNGLVTFQVRGLEFRGTYCQQREVEAISEGVEEDEGCCCCQPGHLPHLLSANAAFNQRWLAWEVTATKYVLEGYSISDNSATSMFQMFELRKILITYYVKSSKLEEWLDNTEILTSLEPLKDKKFADLDPTFHIKIDEDFDYRESGITRSSFCEVYLSWICFCIMRRPNKPDNVSTSCDSALVSLCLALSLLGRRALGPSSQCDNVEVFLQFLHSLFKGDIRPTCVRDEWVFADMELLRKIVSPAVRMSLKLHQDHFLLPDEYNNHEALYHAILEHQSNLVICHEGDPAWRSAILAGRPSLLSLRHVSDDGEDKFKIIMLNKRHLLFRVIKINRECVRGLWAGQQQELVYLRNRNPERGSIQNAKQALRNIINSSCDQPIGYPIYVSPLTTSYMDTHEQLSRVAGETLTPLLIKGAALDFCNRLRQRCVEGCSSGSAGHTDECVRIPDAFQANPQLHQVLSGVPLGSHLSHDCSPIGGLISSQGSLSIGGSLSGHSLSRGSLPTNRGSILSSTVVAHLNKQSSSTLSNLAGLLVDGKTTGDTEGGTKEWVGCHRRDSSLGKDSHSIHSLNKTSLHNSKEQIPYSSPRDSHLLWEPIGGSMEHRAGEKRCHGSSGITFLSRQTVPVGPLDPEWHWEGEATSTSSSIPCATTSTHSLSSAGTSCARNSSSPYSSCLQSSSSLGGVSTTPTSHFTISTRSPICSASHSPILCPASHSCSPQSNSPIGSCGHDIPCVKHQRHQNLGFIHQEKKVKLSHRVRIIDANQVYDTLNLGRRIDVQWPDERMRCRGGRSFWGHWVPVEGMEGMVVHTWIPYHPDPKLRSHVDKTILLLQIDDKFVPVAKSAVQDLTADDS